MFAEIAVGSVRDRGTLERLLDQWYSDLRATTPGFLGGFAGIGNDETFVGVWRFASEAASARATSNTEQSRWWAALGDCLADLERVGTSDVALHGACLQAYGDFTQVIRGDVLDQAAYDDTLAQVNAHWTRLVAKRPEILGRVAVRLPDDRLVDAVFFESEDAARVGEARERDQATAELLQAMAGVRSVDQYTDVPGPRLWW